jgi:malate dehydrogenase (oxaloacetate-decarboxylating)(NADP+)
VNADPSVEEIADMTMMAAAAVRRLGLTPKVALLSHSNFGTHDTASALKMRAALAAITRRDPDLEIDGEMHADSAISPEIRARLLPESRLTGTANLLIMPNLDAANIAFNLVKVLGDGQRIGPMLLGTALPAHILTPSVTARGIFNMTAIAVVDAQTAIAEGGGA